MKQYGEKSPVSHLCENQWDKPHGRPYGNFTLWIVYAKLVNIN